MRVEVCVAKVMGGIIKCWAPAIPVPPVYDFTEESALTRFKALATEYLDKNDLLTRSWLTFAPDLDFNVSSVEDTPGVP